MAPQLAKINEARVALTNASMGITDVQYSLILLNALPASYEVLASTILAAGGPSTLKHSEIIARVINEEGRRSGSAGSSNSSLNAACAAPIKSKGKKNKHSNLVCHYCNNKGHIKPDCQKKKRDEEKKKKEEASSSNNGNKAANSHVQVQEATIIEIGDNDNDISFSLYAANKIRWIMDSGTTHHITPH